MISKSYHIWGDRRCHHTFSQRTGGGGAAAPGAARERTCLPAGSDIANLLEGMEHEEAARLAGLSRSAAYEWHNCYEEDGIEGLRDRPRPGRQPRVDAVTSARFKERIVAGAELQRDGVVAFRGRCATHTEGGVCD